MKTHDRNAIKIPDQQEFLNKVGQYREKTIIIPDNIELPIEKINDIKNCMGTIHSASEDNINYLFI